MPHATTHIIHTYIHTYIQHTCHRSQSSLPMYVARGYNKEAQYDDYSPVFGLVDTYVCDLFKETGEHFLGRPTAPKKNIAFTLTRLGHQPTRQPRLYFPTHQMQTANSHPETLQIAAYSNCRTEHRSAKNTSRYLLSQIHLPANAPTR